VSWFKRSRKAVRTSRIPTWRERRAAERTSRAEAALQQTERKIHEIADQIRGDLKGPA
jgi:adenine-specific DNA methylase